MRFDDLRKLATGSVLFSLDRPIVPRLLTLVYLLGLAGIGLWALNHLFAAFRFGFGNGLWGILEVVVFGLIGFVALRAVCEMVLIYYKSNERAAKAALEQHSSASLFDDVAGAIEELASEEETAEARPSSTDSTSDAETRTAAKSGTTASTTSTKSARGGKASSSASAAKGSATKSTAAKPSAPAKSGPTSKSSTGKSASGTSRRSTTARRTAKRTPKPKSSS